MTAGYLSESWPTLPREEPDDPVAVKVAKRARWQAYWCARLGSPLYGDLIARVADDIDAGGPFEALMTDPAIDPLGDVPMLRLMGAANRLVLTGRAPDLWAGRWDALLALARERPGELREHLNRPVQTNEVGRSGPLAAGFLQVARDTGLPLRLLEVGASAGLNLRFDRYRYETARGVWGPADSPVRLRDFLRAGEPPYDQELSVVERAGCDPQPVDPTGEDGRITLLSYVWPDQLERLANLRGALEIARGVPAQVDQADGRAWVEQRLATLPTGVTSVVYHSVVMPYLSQEERDAFAATVAAAGEQATPETPLAWLRMEYGGEECELRLTLWPDGEERLLADCGFHGRGLAWLAGG
jgi:hypothetical protein